MFIVRQPFAAVGVFFLWSRALGQADSPDDYCQQYETAAECGFAAGGGHSLRGLGTSKAYVVGLAFAVAGYGSFWLIAAMALLTALVGLNYMVICRHYPDGGGVYASVRHGWEIISIVGAFLLIADYLVTAAISALSAFQYLGLPHPEVFAALSIMVIGGLNFFGPRHTGGLAFLVSIPTVVVVVILGLFCLPHLGTAVHNLQPLQGGFFKNWNGFVGVALALSGVEAIANATGVMKFDPGCDDSKPNVSKTSTPALAWVMLEVCLFTVLLSLGTHALPGLEDEAGTRWTHRVRPGCGTICCATWHRYSLGAPGAHPRALGCLGGQRRFCPPAAVGSEHGDC